MSYLIITTVLSIAFGLYLTGKNEESFLFVSGIFLTITGFLFLITTTHTGFEFIKSGHKAKIINEQFGTEYTRAQIFYAGDVIDVILELESKELK